MGNPIQGFGPLAAWDFVGPTSSRRMATRLSSGLIKLQITMDTQSQPLSSLPLPPSTLATLSKAGYETLKDLPPSDSANQLTDGRDSASHLLSKHGKV